MVIEIVLAPVGAGKTDAALDILAQTLADRPLARVWVLVSGKRQETAFRQRLVERPASTSIYFNVEFFTFYELYHRLLNIAQQPPRMLDDAARFGLLRAILVQLQPDLKVYGAIATTPGFVRVMATFIFELKQNLVDASDFADAAVTDKDRDIALIYATYQQRLRDFNLVDREGEGWLALALLGQPEHAAIGQNVDLLIVDGYDQFTPLQASLLMLVAARAQQAYITLTTVPGRDETVGRRFIEALEQLQTYSVDPPHISQLPPAPSANRELAIKYLVDHIFLAEAVPQPAADSIQFIEAPDASQEAAAVLRQVKRLLLAGAPPDGILIALRDWPRYARHLATLGRAFGLLLALHQGNALNRSPVVILLLNLLYLHGHDFRRRDLIDVLQSPYFAVPGIEAVQVEQLIAISHQEMVTGGRQAWLAAVQRASQPAAPVADDGDVPDALLSQAEADDLYAPLERFFDAVTPAAAATLGDYVRWVSDLIGPDVDPDADTAPDVPDYTLRMPQQVRQADTRATVDADLAALAELVHVLRSLLSAETLLTALNGSRQMTRSDFLAELALAIDNAAINQHPVRNGRVLVTTVTDARGLPHDHVFILGLADGIFPVPQAEDPLYLDSERLALNERGVRLETQAERAADDGLFYQLVGLARSTLTLSRPTVQDGSPWLPSYLWRAVRALMPESIVQMQRIVAVAPPEVAACVPELALAVADGLSQAQASAHVLGAHHWLRTQHPAFWQHIDRARALELRRLARGAVHDVYSGRLHAPHLIAYAAEQLGPQRLWSASQLNDYGVCGFRFFAKRLLKLEALEQPEDSLDVAKLGTINHAILEKTYAEIGRRGFAIAPEYRDEALTILRTLAVDVLAEAPAKLGFADDALWEQEKSGLLRRLEALVAQDFSDDSPLAKRITRATRYPYLQEAAFSLSGGVPVAIPIEVNGQPETLRVMGYIDRLDRVDEGVIVVDYKSGTTRIPLDDMRDGRNFQMMVYMRAAEQILASRPDGPQQVLGGLFWHIRNRQSSGEMQLNEDGIAALDEAAEHIGRYIAAGRRGDFTVQPRKLNQGRCVHYCEFAQLCRVAITHRYKPEAD